MQRISIRILDVDSVFLAMSWAFHKSIWVHSRLSYTSRNVYTLFRLTAGLWNGSPHTFVTVGYCVSNEPTAYKGRGDSSKCNLRMTRDNSQIAARYG